MLKLFYNKYKVDLFFLSLLSCIAVLSHQVWFFPSTVISFADIWFQYNETLKETFFTHVWISNIEFGAPNIQLFKFLFTAVWGVLAQINFSYTDVLKITHLIPTAILGFVAPYILFRHFFEEKRTAFIGALFYGSATPFLVRQYQGHASVAFIIAIFPIVFYLFSLALKKNTFLSWLLFVLSYVVGVCYELRIMYIVTIILAFYFLFYDLDSIKKYIIKLIFSLFLFLALSAFWILPLLLGNFSEAIDDVAGRDLFGNAHFSILRSLALFQPYWTGGEPKIFELQPIPFYFWFIPFIVLIFFLFRPDKKHNKILNFFGVVALLGLLLTKQVGEPLPHIFQWLRENVPGFLAFRSGSKFWFILTFSYAGILVYGLTWLYKRNEHLWAKMVFYFCSCIVIGISLLNLKPTFTGEFGGMFQTREIPSDYIILKQYLEKDKNFFRTFWTPLDSRWSYYSQIHPKVSNGTLYSSFWKKNFVLVDHSQIDPFYKTVTELFRKDISSSLFDLFSVKYIVVSLRDIENDDDFFLYYGAKMDQNIRDWYISELQKLNWLQRIDIGTKDLAIFENKNYKPHIYTSKNINYVASRGIVYPFYSDVDSISLDSQGANISEFIDDVKSIIVPIEADKNLVFDKERNLLQENSREKKRLLKDNFDFYVGGYFFKDFILKIPKTEIYTIFLQKESILAKNKDIKLKIGNTVVEQKKNLMNHTLEGNLDWIQFNQVEIKKGEYPLELFVEGEKVEAINQQDIVFAAQDLLPDFQMPSLEYRQVSPSKYVINVVGATESFPLIFSETYHSGWKMFVEKDLRGSSGIAFISKNNQGTIQNNNLNPGKFYDIFSRVPSLDTNHFQVNNFANAWWIDLGTLEKEGKIQKNSDGTYNFSVTLEFEPQKYFYIGLAVSLFTLFSCISYLLYKFFTWLYNRRRKSSSIIEE